MTAWADFCSWRDAFVRVFLVASFWRLRWTRFSLSSSVCVCVRLCFFILFEISFADTSLPPTNQSDFCGNWAHSFDINSRKLFMCLVWFTNYPLLNGFCDLCVGIFFVNIWMFVPFFWALDSVSPHGFASFSSHFECNDEILSNRFGFVCRQFNKLHTLLSLMAGSHQFRHIFKHWKHEELLTIHTHIYRSALIIGVTTLTSMRWWKSIKIPACTPNHFVLSCGFLSTGSHFKWILCSTQYRIIDPNRKYFKGKMKYVVKSAK